MLLFAETSTGLPDDHFWMQFILAGSLLVNVLGGISKFIGKDLSRLLLTCGFASLGFSVCYFGAAVSPGIAVAFVFVAVAHFGGGAQTQSNVLAHAVDVDDGGFQREILQRHLARDDVARRHRAPSQGVQPGGERPDPAVVGRQDQYTRVESQAGRLRSPLSPSWA